MRSVWHGHKMNIKILDLERDLSDDTVITISWSATIQDVSIQQVRVVILWLNVNQTQQPLFHTKI